MKNTLPPINQRIKILIETKSRGNVTNFSRLIGYDQPQKINRLFKIDTRGGNYPTPSVEVLLAISNKFDISLDELVKGTSSRSTQTATGTEMDRLNRQIDDLLDDKAALKQEIRELRETLNNYEGKSKTGTN